MKKLLILFLMVVTTFSLTSCTKDSEYVIKDENLTNSTAIDDNYRVFYEIFTGSFSDSNGDGVGDLKGIINRLDYLNDGDINSGKSLGVQGIWLTPIFKSPTYHKYDVTDYYTIDSSFGDMEDLKTLIDECHKRDIKIILDLVINHTSTQNEWFKRFIASHQTNQINSEYYDFYSYHYLGEEHSGGTYHLASGTNVCYEGNFTGEMPELNFDNPLVREKVVEVAKYYLDMGVDGFRFDAAKYIYFNNTEKSAQFWNWYLGELRKIKPDIYTVGEVWSSDSETQKYIEQGLNCFNFSVSQAEGKISTTAKGSNVTTYTRYVQSYLDKINSYSNNPNPMIIQFIANHDMDRAGGFLPVATGDMYMAASLYILSSGSPFMYYGEEIGIRGSRGGANTDANRRLAMLWGDGDTVKNPYEATYNSEFQTTETVQSQIVDEASLYNHYKKLIMIRNANPEIARGEYKALVFTTARVGGFKATYNGSTVYVIHNTDMEQIEVDLSKVTGLTASEIRAFAGLNGTTLNGNILTIGGKTSVVLK